MEAIANTTFNADINLFALSIALTILVIILMGIPIPGGTEVGIGIADNTVTIALNIAKYVFI